MACAVSFKDFITIPPETQSTQPRGILAKDFPTMLLRNVHNFLLPKEVANSVHLVCKHWVDLLPNDGHLDLSNSRIQGADLARIIQIYKKNCSLNSLNLSRCHNLKDNDLAHLSKLALTNLDLGNSEITGEGLKHLKSLSSLQTLSLRSLIIRDKALEHLSALRITSLDLTLCALITDEGFKHLASLPLENLKVQSCLINGAGLKYLSKNKSYLKCIILDHCPNITDDNLKHLKKISLTSLSLFSCGKITDKSLRNINRCLECLVCPGGITDDGLAYLVSQQFSLKRLSLVGCRRITDKGLEYLTVAKESVKHLSLIGCNITEKSICHLAKLHLKQVFMDNRWINIALQHGLPIDSVHFSLAEKVFLELGAFRASGINFQEIQRIMQIHCQIALADAKELIAVFENHVLQKTVAKEKRIFEKIKSNFSSHEKEIGMLDNIVRRLENIRAGVINLQNFCRKAATFDNIDIRSIFIYDHVLPQYEKMVNEIHYLNVLKSKI